METILITPDVKPPMRETMAEDAAPAVSAGAQEEEAAVPVWTEAEPAAPAMYWPVEGELERLHHIEHLHYDVTLRDWRTHEGIDILAPLGETVCAAMSGTVMAIEDDSLYGTVVTVDHGDGTSALREPRLAARGVGGRPCRGGRGARLRRDDGALRDRSGHASALCHVPRRRKRRPAGLPAGISKPRKRHASGVNV